MKRRGMLASLFILSIFSLNCFALMRYQRPATYEDQMQLKVDMYKNYSEHKLAPYFHHADLPYVPKQIAFLVFKNDKRLELWGRENGPWKHVKNFRILAASGHPGPKLRNMDQQVPEGIYHISALNPDSHFHLSMKVSYPNDFDLAHAAQDGRKNLGGDIFIHGSNRSIGCIAIGDKNIDQLFVLAYLVGIQNVKVIIAPNDLRHHKPDYVRQDPRWTPQLYAKIKTALMPFRA